MTRVAGYQGPASILTQALDTLVQSLRQHGWDSGIEFIANVTAQGEKAADLFAGVERGERHIAYMASGYLSAQVPELEVLDLPFAVQDRAQAFSALDGVAGQMLGQAVARRTGFKVLAFWDNGFRHVTNAVRPIAHPIDAQGIKIRTLDSALYRRILDAMGFEALTSDVKDLVAWVSQGTVQAQENPLTNFVGFELWRHHPHVSLTQHVFGLLLLVCPAAWYDGLNAQQREQLEEAVKAATAQQRHAAAEQDVLALNELQERGVQVLAPQEIDLEAFRSAVQAVDQQARAKLPAELVKAYLG